MNFRPIFNFVVVVLMLAVSPWPAPAQDAPQTVGTVTGLVTNSVTTAPLPGATVWLYNISQNLVATGTTDASGIFTITNVPAGPTRASAVKLNHELAYYGGQPTLAEATQFMVTEGGTTSGIDISLRPYGFIQTSAARSSTGAPIPSGVLLTVQRADGASSVTQNFANGSASMFIAAGDYIVSAWGNDYVREYYEEQSTRAAAEVVTLAPGEIRSGIHFTLDDAGKISGRVTRSDGVTPIADAVVTAINLAGGDAIPRLQTAADGTYLFHGLAPGNYRVQATHQSYISEFYNNSPTEGGAQTVIVQASITTQNVNFTLDTFAHVTGRVTGSDGITPISGASVFATNLLGTTALSFTTTAADGTYFLPFGSGAEFLVRVNMPSFLTEYHHNRYSVPSANILDNRGGETHTNIDFTLTPLAQAASVNVTLSLPITAVKPNAAWRVPTEARFTRQGEAQHAFFSTASSNNNGIVSYTLAMEPGTYTMRIKPTMALAQSVQFTLAAGTTNYTSSDFAMGDSDGNNVINIADFSLLAASFGIASGGNGFNADADYNRDGVVNISDFALLAESFGQLGAG